MERLQLVYDTWQRPDADGLFDYQQQSDKRSGCFIVEKSGLIYRQKNDYTLVFQTSMMDEHKYQPILKIIKKEGRFLMETQNIQNQPLCKIITHDSPGIHQVRKKDKLKMGKVQIEVLNISFQNKLVRSSYEEIMQQTQSVKLQKIRQITPKFYSSEDNQKVMAQSLYQDNPCCRYCYSKTVVESNPFLVSCHCKGFSRYIHEKCLMQWVLKRGILRQVKGKGIFYADSKIFKCELCHQFFYIPEVWKKIYHYQLQTLKNLSEPIFSDIIILHFKYQSDTLYFIDLSKNKTISIGRGLDNEIIINELSVSRQHAFLLINAKDKIVALRDNNSKFGTLALLKMTEIEDNGIYQMGRSKIMFRNKKRKSLFEKIGIFCVVQEKLKKQKKKILFHLDPVE